ncbi:hypothetical protein PIB30_000439 [Stylosanthes scabra]|uniref:Uncharacterized protein n=1 Tax=Stylosanthes scabra TaxID=79078 RepID=A0ABU6V4C9_9FABA|nr:hypothetical protein [Stylosanthes scabra]
MAPDNCRRRGSDRDSGRPRKNTGIPLDLRTTPPTPSISASHWLPSCYIIPTPGVRVHSTEMGGSRQAKHTPHDTDGDGDDEDDEASVVGDNHPLLRWDGND